MNNRYVISGAASAVALLVTGCETIEDISSPDASTAPSAVTVEAPAPEAPQAPTVTPDEPAEAPMVAPPAFVGVNGLNVQEVVFDNGGRLAQSGPKEWTEYAREDGKAIFVFDELGRDEWSVYLKQADSDKHLQIDIHRKKLLYAMGTGVKADLYDLASWSETVTPPTPKYTSEGVNGPNLKKVTFGDKNAAFEETAPGVWTEYNEDGEAFNTFTETHRDDWSVYLNDEGRNIRLQLDVHRKMIRLGQNGGDMMDQWDMTSMWRLN